MNRRLIPLAILTLGLAGPPAVAEEQSVTSLPFVTEIAPINADGLEIPKQRLELTDQGGWLVVSLSAEPDELEWRIVLARLTPDSMPQVSVHPQLPLFEIQYGPWFIRESLGRLRVYREPKDFEGDTWNQLEKAPIGDTPCEAGHLFVVKKDDWYWVCTSPKYDKSTIDTLIRFQHEKLKKSHGSMMFADGKFAEVFCGEARCHDEGDLLVAERITGYGAQAMISNEETKKSIVGKQVPPMDGKAMGQIPMPSHAKLKGKVVLVDFWATWCGPCVKKLPAVNALQEKFADRGLVVVGVHANQNSEKLPEFMAEHEFSFPVVLSDGETEKRFAVSQLPSYFLVGRNGTVISANMPDPPTDAEIEVELAKKEE
ncbi:MAG: redoxin family protein [Planctomycetales bacterium]|nr:redoxin family protein [Planctomycetales bacterium]